MVGKLDLGATKVKDGEYTIGIRPEDFRVVDNGLFTFKREELEIEVIGRDTMVRFPCGRKIKWFVLLLNRIALKIRMSFQLVLKKDKILLFDKKKWKCCRMTEPKGTRFRVKVARASGMLEIFSKLLEKPSKKVYLKLG